MLIMIHSCNKRLRYVQNFLIPDLLSQGVSREEIILWNDNDGKGCLKSWLEACLYICENIPVSKGIWHLQDDILIASDFALRVKTMPDNIICNGFVYSDLSNARLKNICWKTGLQKVENYWFSFPCCYIPNCYIHGFINWFYQDVLQKGKYANKVSKGLYDDFFFWQYMKIERRSDRILNVMPNLVQHVDYMLGGSTNNFPKKWRRPAFYWTEYEREKDLERRIKEWQDQELK